jgi:hypothetical protein
MTIKSAAVLTIHRPAEMSARGRTNIVKWLRRQATMLSRYADKLASRYTARYLYR